MTVVVAVLMVLLLGCIGMMVAVFSMRQDRLHQLQHESKTFQLQVQQQQEKYRELQSKWEAKFQKARERFGKVMDLDDEAEHVREQIFALRTQLQHEQESFAAKS